MSTPPFQDPVPFDLAGAPSESRLGSDLEYWMHVLRERLWLILVILGVTVIVGLATYFRMPRLYASTAVLQVEQFEQKVAPGTPLRQVNMMSLEYTQSLAKAMLGPEILHRTVLASGLDKDPAFAPPRKDGTPYSPDMLAVQFSKKIQAGLGQGTRLIEVTVTDESPERARMLVDTFIREFLEDYYARQVESANAAEIFLQSQARKLKAKLEASERKLQQYKEENDAVSLEETQNIIVQKLKDLNEKVTSAKGERLKLESDLDALRKLPKDDYGGILQIGSVSHLEEVAAAREKLDVAKTDFDTITKRYQYKHWRYIEAKGRIDQLTDALNQTLGNAADILARQYAAAVTTEKKLEESLKAQEKEALELNRIAIPYNVLAREVDSDRKIYEGVIDRLREMNVSETAEKAPFQIIQEAMVPSRIASPIFSRVFGSVAAAGILVCVLVIFVLESANTSFRSVDEVESLLGVSSLAVVPRMPREFRADQNPRPLVMRDHRDSPVAEGFRTLRTALTLLGPKADRKIILITSAVPSEGKSFCALNTAAAFAIEGRRTLLIDADLRRPTLVPPGSSGGASLGLSDLLAGEAVIADAIYPGAVERLDVMPAGRRAPNPSELLAGDAFGKILDELSGTYDHILIDSAPINAVSDTLLLIRHIQKICLVVRVGKTPKKAALRACHLIRKAGGDIAGTVLNRASSRSGGYYYYSYSYERKPAA